ncbi:MAG TPA: PIN domain-containing protein [Acidimicrobiia bacterium]
MAFLIDTSVWTRKRQAHVAGRLRELALLDMIWTCRAVDLELAYSERSSLVSHLSSQRLLLLDAPVTTDVVDRSLRLAVLMAERGLHRHAKPIDLIIACAAMASDLTILHYDRDFDHIGSVTGQPTEWVNPPGTLD